MPKIDEEKKQVRKEQIIKAAFICFSKKGFSKTSMDDIVRKSGISKGGIYVYFKSKDEVFQAIAEEVIIKRKNFLEGLSKEKSNAKKLHMYISNIISSYYKSEIKKRALFSFEFWIESREKKLSGNISKKEYFDKRFKQAYQDLNTLIVEGQNSGEFSKEINIEAFIHVLFATIDGFAFYSSVLEKNAPDDCENFIANLFKKYLLKN